MEVDNEDIQTVASTSSTTETQSITAPPTSHPTDPEMKKGKEKIPEVQPVAAEENITNQIAIPDDAIFEKITRRTQFRAATLFSNIKGKSKSEKFQTVSKQFGFIQGYAGKITQTIRGNTYMVIFFDTEDEMTAAIDKTFPLDETHEYKYVP